MFLDKQKRRIINNSIMSHKNFVDPLNRSDSRKCSHWILNGCKYLSRKKTSKPKIYFDSENIQSFLKLKQIIEDVLMKALLRRFHRARCRLSNHFSFLSLNASAISQEVVKIASWKHSRKAPSDYRLEISWSFCSQAFHWNFPDSLLPATKAIRSLKSTTILRKADLVLFYDQRSLFITENH